MNSAHNPRRENHRSITAGESPESNRAFGLESRTFNHLPYITTSDCHGETCLCYIPRALVFFFELALCRVAPCCRVPSACVPSRALLSHLPAPSCCHTSSEMWLLALLYTLCMVAAHGAHALKHTQQQSAGPPTVVPRAYSNRTILLEVKVACMTLASTLPALRISTSPGREWNQIFCYCFYAGCCRPLSLCTMHACPPQINSGITWSPSPFEQARYVQVETRIRSVSVPTQSFFPHASCKGQQLPNVSHWMMMWDQADLHTNDVWLE